MAHSSTQHTPLSGLAGAIAHTFTGIWDALIRIAEANSKAHQIEVLQAMTDEELKRRGVKREDIVRHVFMEMY